MATKGGEGKKSYAYPSAVRFRKIPGPGRGEELLFDWNEEGCKLGILWTE